ncbi:hypothetical protein Y032_0139g2112 [Ancylostoma ceylanicum]|uniref:Uncharacterized protein n=1 Tax=Ancylostoma ceylanicum TaxID=53326 RepID=A0A016T4K0_9BILA|nr:hypothetical protein Y032_0139g2112 [Ancylostoma ceylanicum]
MSPPSLITLKFSEISNTKISVGAAFNAIAVRDLTQWMCVPFTGFRGGTRARPTAEHSFAPSTHEKERLHFLRFLLPSRSFGIAAPENPEIQENLQCKNFRGCCL